MHEITAARRESSLALALVIFYAAHSGELLYRRYETPPLPFRVHKKASLSEDRLGLARSPRYSELFDMFIQLPSTAASRRPFLSHIFSSRDFLIFPSAIWKNYVARAGRELQLSFLSVFFCLHLYLIYATLYGRVRCLDACPYRSDFLEKDQFPSVR